MTNKTKAAAARRRARIAHNAAARVASYARINAVIDEHFAEEAVRVERIAKELHSDEPVPRLWTGLNPPSGF